jgi:CheY-like chemotaxis protein
MPDPKKYKILIIDDDQFLLDMYSLKFKSSNFDVELALGGAEALEKLRSDKEAKWDGILLDMVMPGMDGEEFLKTIKGEKLAEGASIIVLSNQEQTEEKQKGKEFGVRGYIVKASNVPSQVVETVRKMMEKEGK